jgi:hypothetical protein
VLSALHKEWHLAPLRYAPIAEWTRPGPTCTLTWQTVSSEQNSNTGWKDNTACTYRLTNPHCNPLFTIRSVISSCHTSHTHTHLHTHTHEFTIIPSSVQCHSHNLHNFVCQKHLLAIVFKSRKGKFSEFSYSKSIFPARTTFVWAKGTTWLVSQNVRLASPIHSSYWLTADQSQQSFREQVQTWSMGGV